MESLRGREREWKFSFKSDDWGWKISFAFVCGLNSHPANLHQSQLGKMKVKMRWWRGEKIPPELIALTFHGSTEKSSCGTPGSSWAPLSFEIKKLLAGCSAQIKWALQHEFRAGKAWKLLKSKQIQILITKFFAATLLGGYDSSLMKLNVLGSLVVAPIHALAFGCRKGLTVGSTRVDRNTVAITAEWSADCVRIAMLSGKFDFARLGTANRLGWVQLLGWTFLRFS